MRGHHAIIAMRRQRAVPRIVFIDTADADQQWRHWPIETPHLAHVLVDRDDVVHRLDLRFVVGLPVAITTDQPLVLDALAEACRSAGAAVVLSHLTGDTSWH